MAVEALFFDIGGVVAHADLELYAEQAGKLFGASADHLRAAVRARVPYLERGQMDSPTFWKQVGEQLWSSRQGRPAPPGSTSGLWRKLFAEQVSLDLNLLHLCHELGRGKLVVGALSNAIEEHVEHLTEMGAYLPFRPCILSCRVGCRKPEPEIYKLAAKQAGVNVKKCLLIDDLAENLAGAKATGMQTHLFTSLEGLRAELTRLKVLATPR